MLNNIDKLPNGLKGLIYYKLSQTDGKLNIDLNVKSKFKFFEKLDKWFPLCYDTVLVTDVTNL